MQNGYYQATGAMVTQFNRLDVVTNNLANINTPAFKRDGVVVADFKRIFREVQDELPLENHTKDGARFLNSTIDRVPQIDQNYTDFEQGALKLSQNPLDLALVKEDAFYLLETNKGEIRLSKDGTFQLNEEGFLVNKQGYKVLSTDFSDDAKLAYIQINPNARRLDVDKDGVIYADGINTSSLYIAKLSDKRDLQKDGDNTYKIHDLKQILHEDNSNAVRQGYYEASNVNPIIQMVDLIEANRMVEMYQKVMSSHMNELNQDAITKLASTK